MSEREEIRGVDSPEGFPFFFLAHLGRDPPAALVSTPKLPKDLLECGQLGCVSRPYLAPLHQSFDSRPSRSPSQDSSSIRDDVADHPEVYRVWN